MPWVRQRLSSAAGDGRRPAPVGWGEVRAHCACKHCAHKVYRRVGPSYHADLPACNCIDLGMTSLPSWSLSRMWMWFEVTMQLRTLGP